MGETVRREREKLGMWCIFNRLTPSFPEPQTYTIPVGGFPQQHHSPSLNHHYTFSPHAAPSPSQSQFSYENVPRQVLPQGPPRENVVQHFTPYQPPQLGPPTPSHPSQPSSAPTTPQAPTNPNLGWNTQPEFENMLPYRPPAAIESALPERYWKKRAAVHFVGLPSD
jgi:hypothetical protein